MSACSGRQGGDRTKADNDEADEARDADGVRPTAVCDVEQTGARDHTGDCHARKSASPSVA
jgi:hypothetical protein